MPHQSNPLLGNVEGLVATEQRGDRLRLLMVTDDGESTKEITRLYSLDVRLPRRSGLCW
ncbi:hypothetical protein GCM10010315_41190 [Streptomyces luteosporeus]|uniref:Uncharacterized protein n=1 Tax=Streptomyces luteosporeus TaxID=173856 RepID=A0ABN3TXV0_9ACTN